jgi:hypothetical protein
MKGIRRRHGGRAEHEDEEDKIKGEHARANGGRSPRKGGGGVGADSRPFSSAKSGTKPSGRHTMSGD